MPDPLHATDQTRDVLLDVANERRRQIAKGWIPEHDDRHVTGDMVDLAFSYVDVTLDRERLVKATALLVAAVEALDRRES